MTELLKNKLWLHGSPKQIKQLELTNPYGICDYTNSGLGLILPFAFFISLFDDSVNVYAIYNNGAV